MRIFDRLLMTLLMLGMLAICVLIITFSIGIIPLAGLNDTLTEMQTDWVIRICLIVGAILIMAMSVKVLFSRTGGGAAITNAPRESSLPAIRGEQKGLITIADNIKMTVDAINDIINKSAKSASIVTMATSTISAKEDGYLVRIDATFADGVNIPEMVKEMDERVKGTLSATCGIENVTTEITIGK